LGFLGFGGEDVWVLFRELLLVLLVLALFALALEVLQLVLVQVEERLAGVAV
jgi:hypothetical protein